jgi:hypothetical protein
MHVIRGVTPAIRSSSGLTKSPQTLLTPTILAMIRRFRTRDIVLLIDEMQLVRRASSLSTAYAGGKDRAKSKEEYNAAIPPGSGARSEP